MFFVFVNFFLGVMYSVTSISEAKRGAKTMPTKAKKAKRKISKKTIEKMERVLGRQQRPPKNLENLVEHMASQIQEAEKQFTDLAAQHEERKKGASPAVIETLDKTLGRAAAELAELKIQAEDIRLGFQTDLAQQGESILDMTFLSGMNYCGPGTKIEKNIANNVPPVNKVDALCRIHDIAYSDVVEEEDIRKADQALIDGIEALQSEHLTKFESLASSIIKSGFKMKIFAEDANPLIIGPNKQNFAHVKVADPSSAKKFREQFDEDFKTFQEDHALVIDRGEAEIAMSDPLKTRDVVADTVEFTLLVNAIDVAQRNVVKALEIWKASPQRPHNRRIYNDARKAWGFAKVDFDTFKNEAGYDAESFATLVAGDTELKRAVENEVRDRKATVASIEEAMRDFKFKFLTTPGAEEAIAEVVNPQPEQKQGEGVIRTPVVPDSGTIPSNIHTLADGGEEVKEAGSTGQLGAPVGPTPSGAGATGAGATGAGATSGTGPTSSGAVVPPKNTGAISTSMLNALVANAASNGRTSGVRRLAPFIKIEGSNTIRQSEAQMTETARDFANFSWRTPGEDVGGPSNVLYQMTEKAELTQFTEPLWVPPTPILLEDRPVAEEELNMRNANPGAAMPYGAIHMNRSANFRQAEEDGIKSIQVGRNGRQVGYKINFSNNVLRDNEQQHRRGNKLAFSRREANRRPIGSVRY